MSRTPLELSDAGRARALAGLPALRRAVERRGRRTRVVRVGVASFAGALAVLLAAGAWWAGSRGAPAPRRAAPVPPPRALEFVEMIGTDAGITARVAVGGPVAAEAISDEELRAALAQAGLPDGLVRVGSRVRLSGEPWDAASDAR